jgi:hypothetical protein
VRYAYALSNTSLTVPGINSTVALPSKGLSGLCNGLGATDTAGISMASMPDPHAANKTKLDSNLLRFGIRSSVACGAKSSKKNSRRLEVASDANTSSISVVLQTTEEHIKVRLQGGHP